MRLARLLVSLLCSMTLAATAAEPTYPSGPVKLVVPFAAGGPADAIIRIIADPLSKSLGQPVIVDNRPGAGTKIAIEYVASAPPDGLTLLSAGLTYSMIPHLMRLRIDASRDLVPVAQFTELPQVLIVRDDLPVKNVKELIAYAKANPGKLNYASPGGSGSSLHLQAELLQKLTGTKMVNVPYKGSAPALIDLIAGRVDLMFDVYGSAAPFVKSGKVRILGVAPGRRSALLPDVPTLMESGVAGFDVTSWNALLAPAGTPPAVLDRLQKAIADIVKMPEVQAKLAHLGAEPYFAGPQELGERLRTNSARWGSLIDELGLRNSM